MYLDQQLQDEGNNYGTDRVLTRYVIITVFAIYLSSILFANREPALANEIYFRSVDKT